METKIIEKSIGVSKKIKNGKVIEINLIEEVETFVSIKFPDKIWNNIKEYMFIKEYMCDKVNTNINVNMIIKRFIQKCNKIYKNLVYVDYNNMCINYYSINVFNLSIRSDNDKNNKIRENIIGAIINNIIPVNYYKYSLRWSQLQNEINKFIEILCLKNNINKHIQKCIHKAGRNNHFDLLLTINDNKQFNIEFKFNAEFIKETPQFVSPMKPSQYLQTSYEEYYYDNYLTILAQEFGILLPEKNEYLHKIHSDKPKCMFDFQNKYYNGCKKSSKYTGNKEDIDFYERAKELSEESIKKYITNNELKINELTTYLLKSQSNKYYMLYKNGIIYFQTINSNNYEIISYKKEPKLQSYIATTKTGINLKILLRWNSLPSISNIINR